MNDTPQVVQRLGLLLPVVGNLGQGQLLLQVFGGLIQAVIEKEQVANFAV